VSTGRDLPDRDDALSWDGDDDPTLDTGVAGDTRAPVRVSEPAVAPAPAAGSEPRPPAPDDDEPTGIGNVALVALGVLGGVYLLFSFGWIVSGLRLQGVAAFLVAGDGLAPPTWAAGNAVALVLAAAAPAIWFATVFVLTRRSAPWLRWVLLIGGAVLMVPWPFVMVGAIG
jgi:hypothetical protein